MENQKWYVVIVTRPVGIDKYYRKEKDVAYGLKKLNEDIYPKAKVELIEEDLPKKHATK